MCELVEWPKIIDSLNGTSEGLHAKLDDEGREDLADNTEFLALLDGQIFECAECGWWCEQGEAQEGPNGEDICSDCDGEEAE